jgi:hypothetical protein
VKYIPVVAMILVQQGTTVFMMEVVRRDLFLAVGVSAVLGLVVYFLFYSFQKRRAARKNDV